MAAPTHKAVEPTLQPKIYSALDGNIDVTMSNGDVVTPTVVDHFQADESLPVVVIGDFFGEDLSSNNSSGVRLRARISAVSEARGSQEVQRIKSQVMQQLDRNIFDLGSDFDHVHHKYLQSNPRREVEDGTVRRYIDMDFQHIVMVL